MLIDVYAAVIICNNKILLSSRLHGTPPSIKWEFPGGKIEPGETPEHCIRRELKEELDIQITVFDRMFSCEYEYPDKHVRLFFLRCMILPSAQKPSPQEGQQVQWVDLAELEDVDLLPADKPFAVFLKKVAINSSMVRS